MKKVAHRILKRKNKNKRTTAHARNPLVENARKLLSGDINFFNKLKEKNLRRRLTLASV